MSCTDLPALAAEVQWLSAHLEHVLCITPLVQLSVAITSFAENPSQIHVCKCESSVKVSMVKVSHFKDGNLKVAVLKSGGFGNYAWWRLE